MYNRTMFVLFPCRSREWAVKARREDLLKRMGPHEDRDDITKHISKNNVMCQLHFEESQFTASKKKLIKTAVPTLFNIPNPPKKLAPKRKGPKERQDVPQKPKKKKTKRTENSIGNYTIVLSSINKIIIIIIRVVIQ